MKTWTRAVVMKGKEEKCKRHNEGESAKLNKSFEVKGNGKGESRMTPG